jgi:catechol 2,3-dioxygenase-like lactoylglutathione lyase family enzyme
MPSIGKNFHTIHMSDDFPEIDAWYEEVFGVFRFMIDSHSDVLKRDASLVLIGDFCIEPMAPTFELDGWEDVALGRFFRRFGKRWHSIAWYMHSEDEVSALYKELEPAGIRLYGVTGAKLEGEPTPGGMFTHPRDTVTQLEFVGSVGLADPRFHGMFDPGWWTREHPLHLLKSSHVTLAVRDLERARHVYVDLLGGTLLHEAEMPFTRTRSAFVATGEDLVLELAEPLDADSAIAKEIDQNNEGLYAVTFRVADLGEAESYLRSKQITTATSDGTTLHADPSTTHGALFGFTTADIPNDPRPTWA